MGLTPSSPAAKPQTPVIQVHRKEYLILLILPRKSKTITSIHHVRASASELTCCSLNQNVFVKPDEQHEACFRGCHGEKRCKLLNVFVKPDEQHEACFRGCHGEKRCKLLNLSSVLDVDSLPEESHLGVRDSEGML